MDEKKPKLLSDVVGGALGALVGFPLGANIVSAIDFRALDSAITYAIPMAFIGLGIGIASKSSRQKIWGAIFGLLGGSIGFWITFRILIALSFPLFHSVMLNGALNMAIAGAIYGAFIGLGMGIASKSVHQTVYGVIFGLLGGSIGFAIGWVVFWVITLKFVRVIAGWPIAAAFVKELSRVIYWSIFGAFMGLSVYFSRLIAYNIEKKKTKYLKEDDNIPSA